MRAVLLLAFVVLAFIASVSGQGHGGGECRMPDTNLTFPCPAYNFTREANFEIRSYDEIEIAVTTASSRNVLHAMEDSFPLLYDYFNGSNEAKAKIPFSIPVAAHVRPRLATLEVDEIFFLPPKYIGGAPKPTSPNVTILDIKPSNRVAAHGWFAPGTDTERIFEHAEFLEGELRRLRHPYDNRSFTFAAYDAPEVRGDKLFEVWVWLL